MSHTRTLRDELAQLETDTFEILDVAEVAEDNMGVCSTSCMCSTVSTSTGTSCG